MYHSNDMRKLIEKSGLVLAEEILNVGSVIPYLFVKKSDKQIQQP